MNMLAVTHLACAAAFACLAGLIAAGKPSNSAAWQALLASVLTAVWALLVGFSGFGAAGVIPLAESLRTLAWLVFAGSLLLQPAGGLRSAGRIWLVAAPLLAVVVVAGDVSHFDAAPTRMYLTVDQVFGRVALAVLGILVLENLYRNSSDETRWNVAPICVGLGGIFVFELVVYSDAFLLRRTDPILLAARAVADALAVPLMALAMARNRNWRIDIHVSRTVVFHTATLVASGAFLLSVAAVGTLFRAYGGDWGLVVQLSVIFGGVLVLAMALTSGGIRSRLRRIIAENFFSHRYDYRAEWVKFIDALSSADAAHLQERIIKAVADIVDSPAGALWLLSDGVFRPAAAWNMRLPEGAKERADGPFVAGFGEGSAVQRLDETRPPAETPGWLNPAERLWLAVPLPHQDGTMGFLVLAKSRAPFRLDWEVLQLLGTVARQAASHLAEEQAARALADAKLLGDYSKRFAFVVHDIKNLVSQLGLVLSNAEKFGSDPAFQEDALHTIRSSVDRMNKLLQQLKSAQAPKADASADVEQVAREVAAAARGGGRVLTALSGRAPRASIDPTALHSALTHLVNNAVEASGEKGVVTVRVDATSQLVTIDVCDQGPGMDPAFIRNELFRPFRSTKTSGYGIGAFQTRELIRAAGGDLEVMSRLGSGTTMRVVLPAAKQPGPHVVSAA